MEFSKQPDPKAALAAMVDLALVQLGPTNPVFNPRSPEYRADPGDVDAPFLSEGYLYPLLGKEEARTVLAMHREVVGALGVDALTWRQEVARAYNARARTNLTVKTDTPPKEARDRICAALETELEGVVMNTRVVRGTTAVILRDLDPVRVERIHTRLSEAGFDVSAGHTRIMSREEAEGARG